MCESLTTIYEAYDHAKDAIDLEHIATEAVRDVDGEPGDDLMKAKGAARQELEPKINELDIPDHLVSDINQEVGWDLESLVQEKMVLKLNGELDS